MKSKIAPCLMVCAALLGANLIVSSADAAGGEVRQKEVGRYQLCQTAYDVVRDDGAEVVIARHLLRIDTATGDIMVLDETQTTKVRRDADGNLKDATWTYDRGWFPLKMGKWSRTETFK